MDRELAVELVAHLTVQVVSIAVCLLLAKRRWPQHKDPWMLADTLTSLVVFPVLTAAAVRGVLDLRHTLTSRWTGVTPETRFFLLLYIARGLVHIPVQAMEKMKMQLLVMMTVHHLLSIACFGNALLTGRMHFWACLDGCCEVSTIFLNHVYCGKEFTFGDQRLQDLFPKLFAANGLCLWLSFLLFRLALFPAWLYFWYQDLALHPQTTVPPCTAMERHVYPAVTVLLLVLSCFWFVPITKGMLKALGLAGGGRRHAD